MKKKFYKMLCVLTAAVFCMTAPAVVQAAQNEKQTEAAQDVQAGAAYETYTVQDGDTVMGICKKYYGSISKFSEVIALNHLEDADQLYVGQEIKLP